MKPNIVFILSDDQGYWAMHCAGTEELFTPNLDRIAAEGMMFQNFYCASPVCSPARASILTGMMPAQHGVLDWLRSGNVDAARFSQQGRENPYGGYLEEKKPIAYLHGLQTYTEVLNEAGFTCALSGKWHLGDSVTPQCGFSRWYSLGKGGCHYYHPDIVENGDITVRHGEYVTDLITDRACEDIRSLAHAGAPFYLSVHYTAPHDPWDADQHPKKWIDFYDTCRFDGIPDVPDHPDMVAGPVYGTERRKRNLRGYFAAISAMDEGIGRILAVLKDEGILDDTLVIFTSDNGMSMGHHGIWGKGNGTYPMNMFEEAIKVPFLVRCPGLFPRTGPVADMVSAYDLFPTFCDLVGMPVPPGLPGMSFLPILSYGRSLRGEVIVFDEYGPVRMVRTETWKYIRRYPDGPDELYHMPSDPHEERNVYGRPDLREVVFAMRGRLEDFFARYRSYDFDSAREGVTGSGQACIPGRGADVSDPYGSIPKTRKEM